jgi:succinyl-CoA synthetase alpha subunit
MHMNNVPMLNFLTYSGIAIGGDVFPGSTLSDHILRFNNIPQVPHLTFLYR